MAIGVAIRVAIGVAIRVAIWVAIRVAIGVAIGVAIRVAIGVAIFFKMAGRHRVCAKNTPQIATPIAILIATPIVF